MTDIACGSMDGLNCATTLTATIAKIEEAKFKIVAKEFQLQYTVATTCNRGTPNPILT